LLEKDAVLWVVGRLGQAAYRSAVPKGSLSTLPIDVKALDIRTGHDDDA
jgi:hypothetical protein